MYPRLELEEAELADLSEHGTYVAGFTDSTVEGRTDLYDLFVNVPEASISVAPQSKGVCVWRECVVCIKLLSYCRYVCNDQTAQGHSNEADGECTR